ncbi:hypothetical protein KIW84_020529 [Lathyrus oleraceus]|uniref:Uncharacterized protein n=1 Tax=Pisum sativum TaxID=3888 RepID=A0A9D5B804_PEA|nr:hypothetical protein KIW84_020529 [Pisum sativum]
MLRKNQAIKWNDDCQKAFDKIKEYLQKPPILIPPVPGRPLIMYLSVTENSMGCVLGQHDESGRKEHAIYYLSKKFTDCETRYSLLEKTCCALAWAARRLRQYMLNHTTLLISKMDPVKYIFEKPALTGRVARWQMILTNMTFNIMYLKMKDCEEPLVEEGPDPDDKWTLMFDGAVNMNGNGVGAVLINPKGAHIPFSARLTSGGQSSQWRLEYESAALIPYRDYTRRILTFFKKVKLYHVPRDENQMADALATLSSMIKVHWWNHVPHVAVNRLERPAYVFAAESVVTDEKPWYYDIKNFLKTQEYPEGACVDRPEADMLMQEVHEGSFGTHAGGHAMAKKLLRAGYYWMTMESDCFKYARKCHKCQIYADKVHVPPSPLNVMNSPWPFAMWGIDMIGKIEPTASNGHRFILVAIDYFTKWVEAASYATLPNKWLPGSSRKKSYVVMEPKMNGAVEAANKNIKKIVQKMVVTYKDWHEMLPFALHGYRTSLDEAEWIQTRFNELSLIEERRLAAVCHGQLYQRRMKRAFDQKCVLEAIRSIGICEDVILTDIFPKQVWEAIRAMFPREDAVDSAFYSPTDLGIATPSRPVLPMSSPSEAEYFPKRNPPQSQSIGSLGSQPGSLNFAGVISASSNCVAFQFNMEHYAIEKFKHMHSLVNKSRSPEVPSVNGRVEVDIGKCQVSLKPPSVNGLASFYIRFVSQQPSASSVNDVVLLVPYPAVQILRFLVIAYHGPLHSIALPLLPQVQANQEIRSN